MEEHTVNFYPGRRSIRVEAGTSIWEAAMRLGVRIPGPCGGQGSCGKCKVVCSGLTGDEGRASIDQSDWVSGVRLACRTLVYGDLEVVVPSPDTGGMKVLSTHSHLCIPDLEPLKGGDEEGDLGLVVDIGTTTVAISILELAKGQEVATASDYNRQIVLGEDVLSRIEYSEDHGPSQLRSLVLETINGLIVACGGKSVRPKNIKSVCISGNTTMSHLFLGIDPSPIRYEPFMPVVREARIKGAESGLLVHPEAEVMVMPCISAYVGGDVTSDILHSAMDRKEGMSLLIDVGTNGEVALGNSELLISASSSAGPSFEGGDICCGMRASPGAIEALSLEENSFSCRVIGDVAPKGICGSGLIDLLATLSENGWVDKKGRFTSRSNAETHEGVRRLRITDEADIFITEDDIMSLIRTKGAIFSACRSLLLNLGMDFHELEKVFICGGFGNYLDLESSIRIGLLPDLPRERFQYLGNSSLAGAKMTLLSKKSRERVEAIFNRLTYLDLSNDPTFFHEYSSALFLPHTDLSLFPSLETSSRKS
ncbi:MAG: ASKHA domain-containing protein [Candidatus Methanomethylophilaceae archaeon]|nr:ASKHA domain-containing protein [Candidatus Methanomethylophilaceae archaeon]